MTEIFAFILYPVSAVLWFWHKIFGSVLGPNNGFAWALSVFFLVFSLRALLIKPAISQMRSARKMQKFAPQMQKMREKHKNDKQRMAQEMQKLQREHGVNPVGGCLPALLQIPVFLSLVAVLRDFKPGAKSNFVFDHHGVQSFLDADIFGAKLGNWISQSPAQLAQFHTDRPTMLAVGIPLIIVASVATFFTMRMSMNRQTDASMGNPQTAMVGKLMKYVAPVGLMFSGLFFPMPIAVLLYIMANNIWTFGQTHFLTNKIDREQRRQKEQEIESKKQAPRPRPGQKPAQGKRGVESQDTAVASASVEGGTDSAEPDGASGNGSKPPAENKSDGTKTNGQPPRGSTKSGGKSAGKSGSGSSGKQQPKKNRPNSAPKKSQKKRR